MGTVTLLNLDSVSAHKELDLNQPLYHIMRFKYLKQLVEKKHFRMSKITSWADTYEYPIRAIVDDRKRHIAKNLVGYSMTQEYDVESLWKLHGMNEQQTFDNETICIKINPILLSKLIFNTFINQNKLITGQYDYWVCNIFIGPIKYLDLKNDEMYKIFDFKDKELYPDYMYPAFLKRKNFEYEKEVRLVLYSVAFDLSNSNHIFISLENLDFIEEVIINPFISCPNLEYLEKSIKQIFNKDIKVTKSLLFQNIESEVELVNDTVKYWGQAKDAQAIVSKFKNPV